MPKLLDSTFTRYEFSAEEQIQAPILSSLQRMYLQNELAMVAEKKISLSFTDTQEFIQNEALLTGQIQLLTFLLDNSEVAIKEVAVLAAQNQ